MKSFGRKPFSTLSNTGLQVESTLWIGKLRPVTPAHDPKPQGHLRSWKVASSFLALGFDGDKLERWKHLRCAQDDDKDQIICIMTFLIRSWPWPWPRSNFKHDLLRLNHSSFNAPSQKEHDAGKVNVVSILSQELLPKSVLSKNHYFQFLFSRG